MARSWHTPAYEVFPSQFAEICHEQVRGMDMLYEQCSILLNDFCTSPVLPDHVGIPPLGWPPDVDGVLRRLRVPLVPYLRHLCLPTPLAALALLSGGISPSSVRSNSPPRLHHYSHRGRRLAPLRSQLHDNVGQHPRYFLSLNGPQPSSNQSSHPQVG